MDMSKMGDMPTYEQAKSNWQAFKADFANTIKSVTERFTVQGQQSWDKARGYVSEALRTPDRDAAYRINNPEVFEFHNWMQTPGAKEYYEHATGEQVPGGHWSQQPNFDPLAHYREEGRQSGQSYIHAEVPKSYGIGYDFQEWLNKDPDARAYYEWKTGERILDGHWGLQPVGSRIGMNEDELAWQKRYNETGVK